MKWLKHLVGRPELAQARVEPVVHFIGEQDGDVEQDLKARWKLIFKQHPEVQRAYLAIATYDDTVGGQPVLCIRSSRSDHARLVDQLAVPFKEIFARDCPLDITFLSGEKEDEVRRVCTAFYQAG